MPFTPTSPVTVLTQGLVQGTKESTALAWPAGATTVQATGLLSDADGKLASNQCQFSIRASFDGGKSFEFASGYGWMGGLGKDGVSASLPSLSSGYTAGGVTPTHALVRIDAPQTLSIGATISFS